MGYLITGLVSFAVAMLAFILQSVMKENHRLKQEKEEKEATRSSAIEEGIVCLLRVKLIELHTKHMHDGCISAQSYQNWMLMYRAYKALGGNGMIDHMKAEIEELPMK